MRDPVSGMEFAPEHAAAIRTVHGDVLHFCSNDCAVAYDRNPANYVTAATPIASVALGGAAPARLALPMADVQHAGAPALERALALVPGVRRANVNVKGQQLLIEYDPERTSRPAPWSTPAPTRPARGRGQPP
jgi:YHS domain-containing protein